MPARPIRPSAKNAKWKSLDRDARSHPDAYGGGGAQRDGADRDPERIADLLHHAEQRVGAAHAALRRGREKLSALMVVNSIDRDSPLTNSTATMTKASAWRPSAARRRRSWPSPGRRSRSKCGGIRTGQHRVGRGLHSEISGEHREQQQAGVERISPNANWNISGNRNGAALMAARTASRPTP